MVELSLIEDSASRKELHELIRQHYLYTGSQLARTMLDDWNRYVDDFIQVTPIEYKRVLAEEQMRKLQQKIAEVQEIINIICQYTRQTDHGCCSIEPTSCQFASAFK